jgi:hypothetical protein
MTGWLDYADPAVRLTMTRTCKGTAHGARIRKLRAGRVSCDIGISATLTGSAICSIQFKEKMELASSQLIFARKFSSYRCQ